MQDTSGMIDQSSMMNALIAARMRPLPVFMNSIQRTKLSHSAFSYCRAGASTCCCFSMSDIDYYHFPIGAAEGKEQPNI